MADVSNAILKIENHPLEATYMTDGTNHRDYNEIKSDIQTGLLKTSSETTQNITGSITISGDLTVQGTQHITKTENLGVKNAMVYTNEDGSTLSVNGGIGIKKDSENVYGIVYNPTDDAVKLGLGTADTDGTFTFNSGEGNPVAIRADSSTFTDGHLVAWDANNLKFVDGGAKTDTSNFVTTNTDQTISGSKTFTTKLNLNDGASFKDQTWTTSGATKFYVDQGKVWTEVKGNDGTVSGYYSLLNSATQINGVNLTNGGNTKIYGSNIALASDNAGTLTDAIISANARIDKYKQSAIVDLGTQTAITDAQLAAITADDYSGVVTCNNRCFSFYQIDGVNRIYMAVSAKYVFKLTINTSTKRITEGQNPILVGISSYVKDNLTYSTSGTTYALSAYQGYLLNNAISGKQAKLSDAQQSAVDSGITSTKVGTYDGYATTKQNTITDSNKLSASLVSDLATVATSGSYNDLSDTPTIPTVPTNYVTTDTAQTISGSKTFKDTGSGAIALKYGNNSYATYFHPTSETQTANLDIRLPNKSGTVALADDIPSTYVTTVNGSSGAITNVAKTNVDNSFSVRQTFNSGLSSNNVNYLGQSTTFFSNGTNSSTSSYAYSSGFCSRVASNNYSIYGAGSITRYNGTTYTLTLPTKTGTIALTSDIGITSCTINGSSSSTPSFYAPTDQDLPTSVNGQVLIWRGVNQAPVWGTPSNISVYNELGDTVFQSNGSVPFELDTDGIGTVPLLLGGDAGTSGQVLTSQGSNATPIWKTISSPTFSYANNILTITY